MTDKKRPTWEIVNPDGDYVIVRFFRRAVQIRDEENEYLEGADVKYWVRRGKPMTDAKLKALPELNCF